MSIPNCTWFSQLYWYNSAGTSHDTTFCCLQRKSSPARLNIGSKQQTGSTEVRFCPYPFPHRSPPDSTVATECWSLLQQALSRSVWSDLKTLEFIALPTDMPEVLSPSNSHVEQSLLISAWRADEPGYVCVDGKPTPDRHAQLKLGMTRDLRPKADLSLRLT